MTIVYKRFLLSSGTKPVFTPDCPSHSVIGTAHTVSLRSLPPLAPLFLSSLFLPLLFVPFHDHMHQTIRPTVPHPSISTHIRLSSVYFIFQSLSFFLFHLFPPRCFPLLFLFCFPSLLVTLCRLYSCSSPAFLHSFFSYPMNLYALFPLFFSPYSLFLCSHPYSLFLNVFNELSTFI